MDPSPSYPFLNTYDINHPGVVAFSTSRDGGCSEGAYASFNANAFCGDSPASVERNRALLAEALDIAPSQLVIPHQTHGTTVRAVDTDFMMLSDAERASALEGVDALVTDQSSVCLCVSTADCVPMLFYDAQHHACAAVHAGWRGTLAHIGVEALRTMQQLFDTDPSQLHVIIGPSISFQSFEVGDEVYDSFSVAGFPMGEIAERFPAADGGEKWHIDLWAANTLLLESEGVPAENIEVAGVCTYLNADRFFSARRLGINSGRILNGIMLE